jgi:hypothetical protein
MAPRIIPTPDEVREIHRLLPNWKTPLEYCALAALESASPGSLFYDEASDQMVYHYKLEDLDRDLFDILQGTDEIWVIAGCGVES